MLLADYIRRLIAVNRTETALSVLRQYTEPVDESLYRQVVLHSGNFSRIRADKEKGNLSKADEHLFFSRLNNALLDIADELPDGKAIEVSPGDKAGLATRLFLLRYRVWLLLAFWASLSGLGLWLQSQYRHPVQIALDIQANRASFSTINDNEMAPGQSFPSVELGKFSQMEIPANHFELRRGLSGPPIAYPLESGLMRLEPIPGNESSLFLEEATLIGLIIPRRTQLTLTVPDEEATDEFYLSLDFKPGNIKGTFSYQDSVLIQGSYLYLDGLGGSREAIDLGWISAFAPAGSPYEITFQGNKDHSYLTLEPEKGEGISIQEKRIRIDSLSFIRPINGTSATSSIIEGSIQFLSKRNHSYREARLAEQDFLRLLDYESLEATSLKLGRGYLHLRLAGEVGKVYCGPNLEQLALQNPGILEWLWYNRPEWIFGGLGLSILGSLAMGFYIRKAGRL